MNSVLNIVLFFVFILILLVVLFGINVYVNKINIKDIQSYFTLNISESKTSNMLKVENIAIKSPSWANLFTSTNIPTYSYPSSELFIELDFSNQKKTNILQIKNLDSYKFFCLNEILKSNNIKFAYKKTSDFITLEVALDSEGLRKKLVGELQKYNIAYSIN
ncbi:MAG: hypothetical protein K2P17_05355 [Helicobacteraceae bacterium]|nr:hypothetical protein [Helicobacteraceae bacterium]